MVDRGSIEREYVYVHIKTTETVTKGENKSSRLAKIVERHLSPIPQALQGYVLHVVTRCHSLGCHSLSSIVALIFGPCNVFAHDACFKTAVLGLSNSFSSFSRASSATVSWHPAPALGSNHRSPGRRYGGFYDKGALQRVTPKLNIPPFRSAPDAAERSAWCGLYYEPAAVGSWYRTLAFTHAWWTGYAVVCTSAIFRPVTPLISREVGRGMDAAFPLPAPFIGPTMFLIFSFTFGE